MSSIELVVRLPFERAAAAVREALGGEGFGVVSEVDLAATFEAKLGVRRPPLLILGACNPALAYEALQLDPSVALLLPCNVALEADGETTTRVSIADPRQMLTGAALGGLAEEAARRLGRVASRLEAGSAPA